MNSSLGLNSLTKQVGTSQPRKRVCRGIGSGTGKTGGRGYNGQRARSGAVIPARFEGGQMPIHMRLPKFGFIARKNINAVKLASRQLQKLLTLSDELTITLSSLKELGIIGKNSTSVKIFFSGSIDKSLDVADDRIRFSKGCESFLNRVEAEKVIKADSKDEASS